MNRTVPAFEESELDELESIPLESEVRVKPEGGGSSGSPPRIDDSAIKDNASAPVAAETMTTQRESSTAWGGEGGGGVGGGGLHQKSYRVGEVKTSFWSRLFSKEKYWWHEAVLFERFAWNRVANAEGGVEEETRYWWHFFSNAAATLSRNYYYEQFILIVIIVNSIFLAMSDFRHVDVDNNLVTDNSPANTLLNGSEIYFTVIFTAEMVIKWIGFGLPVYFSDSWHWLDCIVVFFGLLAYVPGVPNVKVFRTFRVLRPLKSVKSFPALAAIVGAVLSSLPLLTDIVIVVSFLLLLFSIAGLQLFGGPELHTRCRLTPFPVNTSWSSGADPYLYKCISGPNFDLETDMPNWGKSDSPWSHPHPECYWPINPNAGGGLYGSFGLCSLSPDGYYHCDNGPLSNLPQDQWSWCGSNYDALGNPRFGIIASPLDTYTYPLYWGGLNFDNLGNALLFVLVLICGNGWSPLMYMLMDSCTGPGGAIFSTLLLLLGTFFILQLIIATLKSTIIAQKQKADDERAELLRQEERKWRMRQLTIKVEKLHREEEEEERKFMLLSPTARLRKTILKREEEIVIHQDHVDRGISYHLQEEVDLVIDGEAALADHLNEVSKRPTMAEKMVIFLNEHDRPDESSFRRACKALVMSDLYGYVINAAVVLNTIIMSMDKYPADESITNNGDAITFVLTLYFAMDFVLRFLGLGIVEYFADAFNYFDLVIVFLSLIDMGVSPLPLFFRPPGTTVAKTSRGSIVALRSLRLLRLLRLFRSSVFRKLLMRIGNIFKAMQSFAMFLFLYIYIMALIGMQFFANQFRFNADGTKAGPINSDQWVNAPDYSRCNFDDFSHAFVCVFQILTLDSWQDPLFNTKRALGSPAMLFPISVVLFGAYVVQNIFLAMLIDNFQAAIDNDDDSGEQLIDSVLAENQHAVAVATSAEEKSEEPSKKDKMDDDTINTNKSVGLWATAKRIGSVFSSDAPIGSTDGNNGTVGEDKNGSSRVLEVDEEAAGTSSKYNTVQQSEVKTPNILTRLCLQMVEHPHFEAFILALILISSITLALDSPLVDPASTQSYVLGIFDIVLTIAFTLEMISKWIALGMFKAETGYFHNSWNLLDFVVVFVSILSLAGKGNSNLQQVKPLRAMRALRPLRLVNRLPGLRAIVLALFNSIRNVSNVAIIFVIIYYIFSILFTSYLKGQFRSCQGDVFNNFISTNNTFMHLLTNPKPWSQFDYAQLNSLGPANPFSSPVVDSDPLKSHWPEVPACPAFRSFASNFGSDESPTSRILCECWGASWLPYMDMRYDNIGISFLTLFQMGALESWSTMMWQLSDTTGLDMQPVRDHDYVWLWASVIFILIGSFLMVQLFVGVIVESFEKSKDDINGTSMLSDEQKEWMKTKKIMDAITPVPELVKPKHPIRAWLFDAVQSKPFNNFITFCILMQCLALGLTSFGQSDEMSNFLDKLNIVLAIIFAIEAAMKITGLGFFPYLSDSWNRLDLLIVTGSIIGFIYLAATGKNTGLIINIVRLLRIARLLRVMKNFKSLSQLVNVVILTLPGIMNIAGLLFLILYIFAVVAVSLFAKTGYFQSYEMHGNFRTFGIAFLTLMRFMTGELWGQYMYDASKSPAGCVVNPPYDSAYCGFNDKEGCIPLNGCGDTSVFFFIHAYVIVVNFVVLSVFISIILSTYGDATSASITPDDFEAFAEHWKGFDPEADGLLEYRDLEPMVASLFEPFGFGGQPFTRRQYNRRVAGIQLLVDPETGELDKLHFADILTVLAASVFARKNDVPNLASIFNLGKKAETVSLMDFKNKKKFAENNEEEKHSTKRKYYVADLLVQRLIHIGWSNFKKNRKFVCTPEIYAERVKKYHASDEYKAILKKERQELIREQRVKEREQELVEQDTELESYLISRKNTSFDLGTISRKNTMEFSMRNED